MKDKLRQSRRTLALPLLALALGVVGCGSSSSNDNSSSAGSGGSDTSAVKATVKQHTKNPTKIGVTAAVGKTIPAGKKIVAVSCGQPGCTDAVHYFQDAAKVLGWQVNVLTTPSLSPQDIQKTEAQAVAMHPDAVVTTSTSLVYFQRQAAQLKAQKIPLIALYGAEPSG